MKLKKHKKLFVLFVAMFIFYTIVGGTFSIYREKLGDSINLNILNQATMVTVNFNANGGTIAPADASRSVQSGSPVGQLPSVTKTDHNFIGWFTDPSGGTEINASTTVTGPGPVNYYAHWVKIICKKAVTGTLHEETCASTGGCIASGHSANTTITYGTIPISNSPRVGDAYDCDVNNDGDWDDETERFYYVRAFGGTTSAENSVLVHYTSFDEDGQMDSSNQRKIYQYTPGKAYLPDSTVWSNPGLTTFDGKVSRYITSEDLDAACGTFTPETNGYLDTCQFYMENSRFQSASLGRSGIWVDQINGDNYRIDTRYAKVVTVNSTSENTVRPTIQIASNAIEDYSPPQMHTISFNPTDGALDDPNDASRSVADGSPIGTLPAASLAHYTLDGWYTASSGGTKISASTLATATTTYYAHWVANITISFNANGGTVSPSSKEIVPGSAIGSMPVPEYTGHVFQGWFTDPIAGTEVTESTTFNASTPIYAHWIEEDIDYVFRIPGECTFTASGITDGPTGDCISTINPTGSNIDYTDSQLSALKYINTGVSLYNTTNHDKDYEIGFTIDSYTFNTSRATLMNTKAEVSTSTLKYPGLVFRRDEATSNYILQSRETLSTNASETFPASTTTSVKIYREAGSIYYSINGGTKTKLNDLNQYNPVFDLTVWFGASPTDSTATAAQRYFIGTLSDMYIKLEADAPTTATVRFDPNYSGASISNETYNIGQAMGTLPTEPTRSGYTFLGWFTDPTNGTQVDENTVITGPITFYAHWAENITITFNPGQDGTVSPTTKTFAPNTAIGELPTPERTGYIFQGWFTDAGTYQNEVTPQTTFSASGSIYAKWAESVTITFNPGQDGTVIPTSKTFVSGTAIGELPTPERTGYEFQGWFTDPANGTQVTAQTVFSNNDTIYAHWEEIIEITITFNPDGGTVSPTSKTIAPGAAIGTLPTPDNTPDKTGYIFVGWYTDNTWATEVTAETTFNTTTTIIARWEAETDVACIGSTCYTTLQSAVAAVPTTGVKTTIKVIQDITNTATTTIPSTKWVELDVGSHTVSTSTAKVTLLTNQGKLDIINGNLYSSGGYVVLNKTSTAILNISGGTLTYNGSSQAEYKVLSIDEGTVNITGGLLTGNSRAATINVNGGVLNVSGGEIKASNTYKGQGIYNNTGTTTISGNVYIENVSADNANGRAAVHNYSGTVTILGGTIVSKGNAAVKNNDIMTIGADDGTVSITSPSMQGHTYGLETVSGYPVTIYDGIFKGKVSTYNKAISDETYTDIGTYQFTHDTETIDSVAYAVAYLNSNVPTCTVTFDPGQDGTVSPTSKTFTSGTAIGALPTPERTGYTFDGWYTAASGGDEVTTQTTFSASDTIYAHWLQNITINFNVNSGDTVEYNTKTLTAAGPIGTLPTASKANAEFLGWFTSASGGDRLLPTTQITVSDNGDTYYAHYTHASTVCRPATTLHSSGGTNFGQIHSGTVLSAGDAYDCDVNGDGTFDATDERFYYLTDTSNGEAVFIFSNNIHQGGSGAVAMCKPDAIAYGPNFTEGPNTAITELPTTTDWSNVNLYTEPRTITNEANTAVVSSYLYTGKAARLATLAEIKAATTSSINGTTNELASYTFLLENTASYGDCRSNYWLETSKASGGAYRIDGASANKKLGNATGSSGVRPVIEVPYSSIDGVANIVEFDTIPVAMRTYFNSVNSWNSGQDDTNYSSFNSSMTANLNNYNCAYYNNDNVTTQYGSVFCDQPNKYDTGTTGNINVYEYNETTGVRSNTTVDYVFNDNGKLYNFIPGKTYYWESASDSTINGYVRPTGERRLITIPGTTRQTRNVRDLGGLPVDTNGDGTIDGKIKYQKLYRGEKIWGTNRNGTVRAQFEKLGIYNEYDLRTPGSEIVASEEDQLSNYISNEIVHYKIDYTEFGSPASEPRFNGKSYYQLARDAAIDVMQRVVAGNNDYALYFHCRIGADRTGTLAYLLEGVLGVPTEYRHQDYELTTFFGLRERTRYYYRKDSTNDSYKFLYLKKAIRHATPNNNENTGEENVMDWFLLEGNSTNDCSDITALINQFRTKMIDYN